SGTEEADARDDLSGDARRIEVDLVGEDRGEAIGGDEREGTGSQAHEDMGPVPRGLLADLTLDAEQGAQDERGEQELDLDEARVLDQADERFHTYLQIMRACRCRASAARRRWSQQSASMHVTVDGDGPVSRPVNGAPTRARASGEGSTLSRGPRTVTRT